MGLSFSDYFSDEIPPEVKPVPMLRAMEEADENPVPIGNSSDGWLDRNGNYYSTGNATHNQWALAYLKRTNKIHLLNSNNIGSGYEPLFKLGFLRIKSDFEKEVLHFEYNPFYNTPTYAQFKSLKDFCIEHRWKLVDDVKYQPVDLNENINIKKSEPIEGDGWLDPHGNYFNASSHFKWGLEYLIKKGYVTNRERPFNSIPDDLYDKMSALKFVRVVFTNAGPNNIWIEHTQPLTPIQARTLKNYCIEYGFTLSNDSGQIDLNLLQEQDFPIQAKDLFKGLWEDDDKSILLETHLQDLYHATNINSLLKILQSNSLKLAFVGGTKADQDYNHGYPFFLSTMRQKYGNFARGTLGLSYIPYEVVIHIDGHAVRDDGYKTIPVNYWGQIGDRNEQEERIVSDEDEMKPLERYVKDIHVFVSKDLKHQFIIDNLHRINNLAQQSKIPIYFYTDPNQNYFRSQRTEKAVRDVNRIIEPTKYSPEDIEWVNRKKDLTKKFGKKISAEYIDAFLRIYYGDYSKVDKFPDRNVLNWLLYYPDDAYAQLFADIHNYKKEHLPIFKDVVTIMKREGVKTFKELIDIVMKREQDRIKSERDKLNEVEDAFAPGKPREPRWELSYFHAKAIFTLFENNICVMMKQGTKRYTFYSNDKLIEKELNREEFQKLEYADVFKFTHDRMNQYLRHALSIIKKTPILETKVILSGRVFSFPNIGIVVGFWQTRQQSNQQFERIKWIFEALNIDPKKCYYTFNNNARRQYTFDQWIDNHNNKNDRLTPYQKRIIAIQRKIHTNPELKKAFIKLPLNKLQIRADVLNIPLIQLKQMLGSID